VLILRTLAIWHGGKRIGIFLGTLAIGFVIPTLYYTANYAKTFTDPLLGFENLSPAFAKLLTSKQPSCYTDSAYGKAIIVLYALFMIFEAVILLFTLLRANASDGVFSVVQDAILR